VLEVGGIFIFIGSSNTSSSTLIDHTRRLLQGRDDDDDQRPGIFAAGDVRSQ